MTKNFNQTFEGELHAFFVLSLLSMVFGALVLAIGMQSIIIALLGLQNDEPFTNLSLLIVLVGCVAIIIGFSWLFTTMKVFRPVHKIRKEYRAMEKPVADIPLTGLIVRMIASYRENKTIIKAMTLICAVGGLIYLSLGITNVLQGISSVINPVYSSPGVFTFLAGGINVTIFAFLAAGINMTIGIISLLSSIWFHRYSAGWDARLDEVTRSEKILKEILEEEKE